MSARFLGWLKNGWLRRGTSSGGGGMRITVIIRLLANRDIRDRIFGGYGMGRLVEYVVGGVVGCTRRCRKMVFHSTMRVYIVEPGCNIRVCRL